MPSIATSEHAGSSELDLLINLIYKELLIMTTPEDPKQNWHWGYHDFKAMNTKVYTWLYSQVPHTEILLDVERLFASFEKRLSRFNPQSELSKLNAHEQAIFQASPTLLDALEIALWAAEITGGLYDPTMLTYLEKAGYDCTFEKITQPMPLFAATPLTPSYLPPSPPSSTFTFRSIQLNRPRREIHKPPGLRLDLGGMGKGWAVDRTADRLQGLGPFLVNAGGDIFAYQSPPGKKGWEIDLIHPLQPQKFMARIYLDHQALATSTIAKRRWQHNQHLMHHIIDPRSGQPAQTDALSVTVIADRTVLAEVYAKVALMLGVEQGLAYLQSLPAVEGLIFTAESKIVYTAGLETMLAKVEPAGVVSL